MAGFQQGWENLLLSQGINLRHANTLDDAESSTDFDLSTAVNIEAKKTNPILTLTAGHGLYRGTFSRSLLLLDSVSDEYTTQQNRAGAALLVTTPLTDRLTLINNPWIYYLKTYSDDFGGFEQVSRSYGGTFSLLFQNTENWSTRYSFIRSRRFNEDSVTDLTGFSISPKYQIDENSSLSASLGHVYIDQDGNLYQLDIYSLEYQIFSASAETKISYERNVTAREEGGDEYITDQFLAEGKRNLSAFQTLDYGAGYRHERQALITNTEVVDAANAFLGFSHSLGTKMFPRELRYPYTLSCRYRFERIIFEEGNIDRASLEAGIERRF